MTKQLKENEFSTIFFNSKTIDTNIVQTVAHLINFKSQKIKPLLKTIDSQKNRIILKKNSEKGKNATIYDSNGMDKTFDFNHPDASYLLSITMFEDDDLHDEE